MTAETKKRLFEVIENYKGNGMLKEGEIEEVREYINTFTEKDALNIIGILGK